MLDRVAEPYVEQSVRGVVDSLSIPMPPSGTQPVELHTALHEARSLALADMPRHAETILSAGANGLWYFQWFEQEYGPVKRHIGVEAYMPRPHDLPENVLWVDADLAGPGGVAAVETGTVDLVFSGQNVEHLWPEQMVAFLCESNRVLKDSGLLVLDSPNRSLTAAYRWSMGEHTVELEPDEATEILSLAGFAVERMKGLWLCREGGRLLDLEPSRTLIGPGGLVRRVVQAAGRPEDSFIWWAEARKSGEPDIEGLHGAIVDVFEASWPERVTRVKPVDADTIALLNGAPGVRMAHGTEGYAFIGPFMAVAPGTYEFTVPVEWENRTDVHRPVCRLELVADDELIGSAELTDGSPRGATNLSCTATLATLRFAVHARLWCSGAAEVRAPLTLSMHPDPWRTTLSP